MLHLQDRFPALASFLLTCTSFSFFFLEIICAFLLAPSTRQFNFVLSLHIYFRAARSMCSILGLPRAEFQSQLCPSCAKINWQKRNQVADLTGRVALITGGRIKIGYLCVLRMLRCGATCIVTTRFPNDAAERFAKVSQSFPLSLLFCCILSSGCAAFFRSPSGLFFLLLLRAGGLIGCTGA